MEVIEVVFHNVIDYLEMLFLTEKRQTIDEDVLLEVTMMLSVHGVVLYYLLVIRVDYLFKILVYNVMVFVKFLYDVSHQSIASVAH